MPVETPNDEYNAHLSKWARIRDVVAGVDAVKGQGKTYLPKPNGHDESDYEDYKQRAEFYPASQRTVDGLVGAIFRKDPVTTGLDNKQDLLAAVTLQGQDLNTFAKSVTREVVTMGRYGVLVDVMADGDNSRPFFAGYTAESIINWRMVFVDRKPVLSLVILKENVSSADPEDEFNTDTKTAYRVLQLAVEEGQTQNFYIQRIFIEVEGANKSKSFAEDLTKRVIPTRRGERLTEIPFQFFGTSDLLPNVEKSPILDLVDTNLSHYRTSAELEEGAYLTGLPMYVISGRMQGGDDEDTSEVQVGSRRMLMLEENGTAAVLSVSGEGMGLLTEIRDRKEQHMAVLGARILEDQKAAAEAATTVTLRHRGENSLLASISDTTSRGLKALIETLLFWDGEDNVDITVELNKDFITAQMTPQELVQFTSAFQTGAIGPEVFFKGLKDGERVPNTWTLDDWLADAEAGRDLIEMPMGDFEDPDDEGEE